MIAGGGLLAALVAFAVWVVVVLFGAALLISALQLPPEAQALLAVVQLLFRLPLFVLESLAPLVQGLAGPDAGC